MQRDAVSGSEPVVTPSSSRLAVRRAVLPVALVGVVLLLVQPASVTPGDPTAVRLEARYLVRHGTWGIPFADREFAAPALPPRARPGQYLFENAVRQRYFSRWGVFTSLLFAPPLLVAGERDAMGQLVALNLYNLAWSLVLATGLALWLARHASRWWTHALVLLATLLGTHALFYLRAQTSEVIQMALFTWSALLFHDVRAGMVRGQGGVTVYLRVGVLGSLLGALFLLKVYFLPLLFLAPLLLWWPARTSSPRQAAGLLATGLSLALAFVALRVAANVFQFNDPWDPGIGAPEPGAGAGYVSTGWMAGCMASFVAGAHGSLFLHAPVALVALLGLVSLFRRDQVEAVFVTAPVVLVAVVTSTAENCLGEWSHGPRYLVPVVPLLALPALVAVERALETHRHGVRTLPAALGVVALLGGGWMQLQMLRHAPFAYYQLRAELERVRSEAPTAAPYFRGLPQAWVMRDLDGLCRGDGGGHLAEVVSGLPGARQEQVGSMLGPVCRSDLLLARLTRR